MNRSRFENIHNILIVNVHSAHNAGDFALLHQTIYYLKHSLGEANINLLANWPNEKAISEISDNVIGSPWWVIKVWDKNKKPRYQVLSFIISLIYLMIFRLNVLNTPKRLIPQDWHNIFSQFSHADLVVAVSGNQLFSSGRLGWPLPVVAYPIFLANIFKKKTIIFPQSVGPFNTRFEKAIVKFVYNNVEKLYIRDLESLKLIQSLNIEKSHPSFMHDIAFTFPPARANDAKDFLRPIGYLANRKKIGMTIISPMPSYLSSQLMQNYYQSIAVTIEYLVNQSNFDVFLFCQVNGPTQDENDRVGIEKVLSLLADSIKKNIHILPDTLTAAELKAAYGLMDIFVASRLHSGIFSLGMRVPTLFVGYLYKTKGILEAIGLTEYNIELSQITANILIDKIDDVWKRKNKLQEQINTNMLKIEHDLAQLPTDITKVLFSHDN